MTADTLALADFLLARIAEQRERAWGHGAVWEYHLHGFVAPNFAAQIVMDCDVKRRIVETFADASRDGDGWNEAGVQVLELLATSYADHPDYDPRWSLDA